jgi:hypothetical protein
MCSRPRRNRVHDVVYRVPAGEKHGLLSRGPKFAVEAQNEVASILRYRLG